MSGPADQKMRWGGILENPVISMVQRALLDAGRVARLKSVLKDYRHLRILEVGCGLGECSAVSQKFYYGVDNSFPRIRFAAQNHAKHSFLVADAGHLPFRSGAFEMGMLLDTAHHLSDIELIDVLKELRKTVQKYLLVIDPIVTPNQNPVSRLLYRLDRGGQFRTGTQFEQIFKEIPGLEPIFKRDYRTFPGFYLRRAFLFKLS